MSEFDCGLVKREIMSRAGEFVEIRETWNLRHPRCPFVMINGLTSFEAGLVAKTDWLPRDRARDLDGIYC